MISMVGQVIEISSEGLVVGQAPVLNGFAQVLYFVLASMIILVIGLPSSVILGLIVGWKNQRIFLGIVGGVVGGAIGGFMGFTGRAIFISPMYFQGIEQASSEEVLHPSIGGNLLGTIIIAWLLSRPKKPPLPDDSPETDGSDLYKTRRDPLFGVIGAGLGKSKQSQVKQGGSRRQDRPGPEFQAAVQPIRPKRSLRHLMIAGVGGAIITGLLVDEIALANTTGIPPGGIWLIGGLVGAVLFANFSHLMGLWTALADLQSSLFVKRKGLCIGLCIALATMVVMGSQWDSIRVWYLVKPGANLEGTNLIKANLEGTNLRGANMTGANMRDADLTDADLTGANLRRANLRRANLADANLESADLESADLPNADLTGAKMRGADLTGADLTGADLTGANVQDANFRGTTGLNLEGTVGTSRFMPDVPIARYLLETRRDKAIATIKGLGGTFKVDENNAVVRVYFEGTKFTDSGLVQLKRLEGLTNLQLLWLRRTKVTDEGVEKLQQALPKCKIWREDR